MVEIIILYILNRHELTIYKLERSIKEFFGTFAYPSFGSIAPALNRLSNAGFLEFSEKFSQGGLKSKTYSITGAGIAQLKRSLVNFKFKNVHSVQKSAAVLLFCLDVLNAEERSEVLKNVENNLKILRIEIENELTNPYVKLEKHHREILKNQIVETDADLALLKRL